MNKWGTPNTPPDGSGTSCYCLEFPNTREIHGIVNAAISQLIYESQFFEEGSMTVEAITQVFKVMYLEKRMCSVIGEIKESVTLFNIPQNWHLLDGSILTRDAYPELWQAVPIQWRLSNPDRIQLPNTQRSYTAHGFVSGEEPNYTPGTIFGSNNVTLSLSQIPSHNHNAGFLPAAQAGTGSNAAANPLSGGLPVNTTFSGGGQAHENRPLTFAVYRFIVVKR